MMFIEQFLNNHPQIKISPMTLTLCKMGEEKMNQSIDDLHSDTHIKNLLKDLTAFLQYYPHHKLINFEVLLLAICWHDTWKAKKQSYNLFILTFYQIYEGIGSMILFSQASVGLLPQHKITEVNYAIRKHSQLQFLPLQSLEAIILKDLDLLAKLDPQRMKILLEKSSQLSSFTNYFGKKYIEYLASEKLVKQMNFSWTKHKARKINKIINQILSLI